MMNLGTKLKNLDESIRVGIVGTGFFGSHLLQTIEETPGMETSVVCDVEPEKAFDTLKRAGLPGDAVEYVDTPAESRAVLADGKRAVTSDGTVAIQSDIDVFVEATGNPNVAASYCFEALVEGTHVVNVTVEADTVCGPLLARIAENNDAVYTLAAGDQHGQIVQLCEWAESCGLEVIAAGSAELEGLDHHGKPDDALERWPREFSDEDNPNARMYNTFLDGTKASVEFASAANALGLSVDSGGLHEPEIPIEEIPETLRPESEGGILSKTEVIEGVIPTDGSFSVFVVTRTGDDRLARYFADRLNVITSSDGNYQLFYRPHHFATETTTSIASAALYGEATARPAEQTTEVVARAKKNLQRGDEIDGPGGYMVYGTVQNVETASDAGYVPFELLAGAEVTRQVEQDEYITADDVEIDTTQPLYHLREIQDGLLG